MSLNPTQSEVYSIHYLSPNYLLMLLIGANFLAYPKCLFDLSASTDYSSHEGQHTELPSMSAGAGNAPVPIGPVVSEKKLEM
jgi:hypothetical protein